MATGRVVITTLGSLGDLHPYLAVGQELRRRGLEVRVVTQGLFQERVEAAGLAFAPLRATAVEAPSGELMRRVFDGQRGLRYLIRDLVMPELRRAYEDTLAAADGADLLLSHPLTFATPLVAGRLKVTWISTQLAPVGLLSAYDPPVMPGFGTLRRLGMGRRGFATLFQLGYRRTRVWMRPVDALREELGLPDRGNPLFAGGHAPGGVLALFSRLLAEPQPDWPARVTVTGFPFYAEEAGLDPALEAWLAEGEPPVVFTLGSSAVMMPGDFFAESAAAARSLGRRALLLGYAPQRVVNLAEDSARPASGRVDGDPAVFAAPYASYARVFPRAAAVVHQGGIGTTAEALRAGRPMLVVPWGVDQPDNGARAERLGVGRVLARGRYRAPRAEATLRWLLREDVTRRSEVVGEQIREEKGAARAADVVEEALTRR